MDSVSFYKLGDELSFKTHDQSQTVLLIGPLPPPIGGQSILIESILTGSLRNKFQLLSLNVAHGSMRFPHRLGLSLKFIWRLLLLLCKHPRIHTLHIHTSAGTAFWEKGVMVAAGKLFGKSSILHIHGGNFLPWWESAGPAKRTLIRSFLNLNNIVIVLSSKSKDFYLNEVGCSAPVRVLENAVRVPQVEIAHRSGSTLTFLYVGHLKPEKGLLDLAAAIDRLDSSIRSRICMKLMGDGENTETAALIQQAFLNKWEDCEIHFLGPLSGADKWSAFSSSDVFVLPSHSEDMPLSIIEAMSLGKPVLATHVGAIPSLIVNGSGGYLFSPRDVRALSDIIQHLVEHPQSLASMGNNNRERAKQMFSFESYESRLEKIYLEALIH